MEQQMLAVVNETRKLLPGPCLLHELVSTSAEESIALDFLLVDDGRVQLTYADFRSASLELALQIRQLLATFSAKHHVIPVVIPQSPELYIAWQGVLQAGAAFCPVQSDIPAERLKFIASDVSANLILCLEEHRPRLAAMLPFATCLCVSLNTLQHKIRSNRQRPEFDKALVEVESTDLAYVMYTSGSTGLPKGVKISHQSVTQSLLAHEEHIPIFKRFLQFAAPTFDVSVFEIFFPLLRGATLAGCSRERMLADLPGTIRILGIDAAELTPTVAGALLRTRDAAPCLRTLLTIGEMLTKSVVQEFGGSEDRESILFAMYGPTEAAVHCTVAPRLPGSSSVRNIGRPFSTVTAFILQESSNSDAIELARMGEAGELAIAGQLADGYLNRPDQTEAAFVTLPGHGQIYRTGDRAICYPDGGIEIMGRLNSGQVKLRGQRVELGEIEEIAAKTAGVTAAVAMVVNDALVLFYSSDTDTGILDVQSTCKAWLPPFMRPSEVLLLQDGFPRLPSGKIDRKKLESDYSAREAIQEAALEEDFECHSERILAAALQRELGTPLSRHTDLYSCGLDSLRAIKVATHLRSRFTGLSVNTILESDTIADLATRLLRETYQPRPDPISRFEQSEEWFAIEKRALYRLGDLRESVVKTLPCSSMQIEMLAETATKQHLNFNCIRLRTQFGISESQVWNAFCKVAEGNEILRSGFLFTDSPTVPFVQVVWSHLERSDLDLLHPLQLSTERTERGYDIIVRIHHALYDGWSWELVLDDLNDILANINPPTRPSFETFSSHHWHLSRINDNANLDYWEALLSGSAVTRFPVVTTPALNKDSRESVIRYLEVSYSHLSALSSELRTSRQTLLQACWVILLSAFTDSANVLSGVVVSGRNKDIASIDQIIGPCLSTLPFRVDLDSVKTVRDLVFYIQRQWLDCLKYSDTPLRSILKTLNRPNAEKVFDTIFVWQEGETRPPSKRRLVATADTTDVLDYPALLELEPVKDCLKAKVTVATERISLPQADLLLQQLDALLSRLASSLDIDLSNVWQTCPQSILSITNSDYTRLIEDVDLTDTIRQLARTSSTRPAIRFVRDFDPSSGAAAVEVLSFGDLYTQASSASAVLASRCNIKPGQLVGIIAAKSLDLYVAILAVILSGAGYMYIDPNTPTGRINLILQQAGCALILTDGTTELDTNSSTLRIRNLLTTKPRQQRRLPRTSPQHLAYAIFTSGTTGVPKGVLITRINLLSNILHLEKVYPCEPASDSLLQASSPAFDVSVFEIFWTWHMGMTICAAPNDVLFRDIESLIHNLGVTHLSMTPSVAALVHPDNVPGVKMLVTAGEPMNSKVLQSWAGRGLYQGYGPSETTNICNVRPNVSTSDAANNVGPAFPNTSVFICAKATRWDAENISKPCLSLEDFRLLPRGAVGEIWIGGDQVGRGYIDEVLTKQSFLDHPQYGRLYRSGDTGRLLSDDSLVILGRTDDQAKIRGQRVELGEINTALLKNESIRDAVSIVGGEKGVSRLLSFCVYEKLTDSKGSYSLVRQLFDKLEAALPSYMIPDAIFPVVRIPLTKQGKIDRQQLMSSFQSLSADEAHAFSRQQEESVDKNQLNEMELRIAKALSEAVNVPLALITHNCSFYALGLDSISCIRFSQLLVHSGFARVDVSTILRHASMRLLSQLLAEQPRHGEQKTMSKSLDCFYDPTWLDAIRSKLLGAGLRIQKVLPCTDPQLSMLSRSEGSSSRAYQNTIRFAVKGSGDRLRSAWNTVLHRHDLLRAAFVRYPSSAMPYAQVILEDVLSLRDSEEVEGFRWHVDDIFMINPCRINIFATQNTAAELTLEVHHALYDAESMTGLLREVEFLYHGHNLSPVSSFDKYLCYMLDLDQNAIDSFWESRLQGMKPCVLADILSPQSITKGLTTAQSTVIGKITLEDLEASARHQRVSILALLQCALARLLYDLFGGEDICFGNVFSGRTLPIDGIEHVFGPCFNTLPIRVQLKRSISNQQLATALQDAYLRILPFQPSSLRKIQRQHSPDGKPLFDVLILLQQPDLSLEKDIWELLEDSGDMSFPFILEVHQDRDRNQVRMVLHSEVASGASLEQILNCFNDLLRHLVAYPEATAADFSFMNDDGIASLVSSRPSTRDVLHNIERTDAESSRPWSTAEMEVREILRSLCPLKQPSITKQTSLFKLGLDSINAVQIAARLGKLGYQISSSNIMETPTVAEIAARCGSESTSSPLQRRHFDFHAFDLRYRSVVCQNELLDPSKIQIIRPCSPTQSGILTQYLNSRGRFYYNTVKLRLANTIDTAGLRRSWQVAMERHQMLRTGFVAWHEDGFAFLMVTFYATAATLPWTMTSGTHLEDQNGLESSDESLLTPPWRLRVLSRDGHTYLIVSMLHALYDAKSMDIILSDVANSYLENSLPAVTDIAPTISSILMQSESRDARTFWKEGINAIQPTKFPNLHIYLNRGRTSAVVTNTASLSLSDVLLRVAKLETSLQAICQAAWARLLAAYTGQSRVTFGLILSGRTLDDFSDDAVFPCINTIPCSIDAKASDETILAKVSALNARLLRHQHTPLPSIKRWQMIEDEAFDTILVLQKLESNQPERVPWTLTEDDATAEYAVSLEVLPDPDRDTLLFRASYSEYVLPAEAATQMLDQVDGFIMELLDVRLESAAIRHCSNVSIVSSKDDRIGSELQFLHQMVERTVVRVPDSPALEYVRSIDGHKATKDVWSYAELDEEGNRIANLLLQNGSRTGDLIAVCFDKCPQASFAILGVLKAGCAYVAIDPGTPPDRKQFILQDSGSKIALTTKDKISDFPRANSLVIAAVDDNILLKSLPRSKPRLATPLNPKESCYCLYTSGSTGTPKGCLISHNSAVQAMLAFERIFQGQWTAESRWLQFASFHFDVSVLEQYWSWYVGICVTSAPRDLLLEDLPEFIRKMKITHLDLTPSLARLLKPEKVPSLCAGVFIVGGEQVSQDIVETWGDVGCLYNFYGPSEVTIGCTVRPRVTKDTKPTNIGQQWDNVGTFVLEPGTENAVIRGGVGELCLSGVLVGKGYLNRPELTAKSFTKLQRHDTLVYRTGDLVRLLYDGSFEFLGRIDDQVKLRGQRLEIGEINQVIRGTSPDLKAVATVVAIHPSQGKQQLISFFSTSETKRREYKCDLVVDPKAEILATKVRKHCVQQLPGYMVPSSFLMVSCMPLNVNNKIDSKALIELYKKSFHVTNAQHVERPIDAKDSEIFDKVSGILQDFFRVSAEQIKPDSTLFGLGLDSISAIGLSKLLRTNAIANADATTLMKSSVVRDLVNALETSMNDDKVDDALEVSKQSISTFSSMHRNSIPTALGVEWDHIESISPCSPLQEGMISKVMTSEVGDPTYFTQFHYDLKSHVNPEKLRDMWRLVERSTSILRTHFVPTTHGFAQVVLNIHSHGSAVESKDMPWTKNAFKDWVQSTRTFVTATPWRLSISHSWDKVYMTLFIFHGLYDGVSLPLLLEKVGMAYASSGSDNPRSDFQGILPHGPLRHEPGARDFWLSKLPWGQKLNLSVKYPTSLTHEPLLRPSKRRLNLRGIEKLCRSLEITVPAVFQAAWLLCLHQVYGANPTLGIVVSGRNLRHLDAESVIGPMFNTIPFAIRGLPEKSNLQELAKACHRYNVDVLPYQHTALRNISKWIGKHPSQGLFDVLFVFQKEPDQFHSNELWRAMPAQSTPEYPLNLEVEHRSDGSFTVMLVAKQDYVSFEETETLLEGFSWWIQQVAQGKKTLLPEIFTTSKESLQNRAENKSEARLSSAVAEANLSPIAEMIRQQISDLAGVPATTISLHQPSLLELGLDSIDAMNLATRLRNEDLRVPVSKIMQAPTVAGIVCAAQDTQDDDKEHHTVSSDRRAPDSIDAQQSQYRELLKAQGISLEGVDRVLPVTPMQEGLLLDFDKYYNVVVFQLEPDVDLRRLKYAWRQVICQQPILRTRFVPVEDSESDAAFLQVVEHPYETTLSSQVGDVASGTVHRAVTELKDYAKSYRFTGAALTIRMFEVQSKVIMLLGMPHAVYDAWSLHLLHQEVFKAYETDHAEVHQNLVIPYEAHLESTRRQVMNDRSKSFWKTILHDVQPSIFEPQVSTPTDSGPQFLYGKVNTPFDAALDFCKSEGITLQSLGLACWLSTVAHYVRNLDVCFGLVLSGRTTEGSGELLFPTFNTVVFRSIVKGSTSRSQFVKQVHDVAVRISEHQSFPLREAAKLADACGAHSELFNTLFTYQKTPETASNSKTLYHEIEVDEQRSDFPYAINIEMEGCCDGLWWTIATKDGVMDRHGVEEVLATMDIVLKNLIEQSGHPVIEIAGGNTSICGLPGISLVQVKVPRCDVETANDQFDDGLWTEVETTVRQVLATVSKVGVNSIKKTTGFFNLGLDSISAIKVVGLLRKEGVKLPVSKIIEAQTVERIAAIAQQSEGLSSTADQIIETPPSAALSRLHEILHRNGLHKEEFENVFPATAGQLYMLDASMSSGGRLCYPSFWLAAQGVTKAAFDRSITHLMKNSPLLRTTFFRASTGPREEVLQLTLTQGASKQHDLPWAYLAQEANHQLLVHLKLHHALYDAVSFQLMIAALQCLCATGQTPLELNTDFAPFLSSTTILDANSKQKQREFWTSYFSPRPENVVASAALKPGSFDTQRLEKFDFRVLESAKLDRLLKMHGISIQSLFFASCAKLYTGLSSMAGQGHKVTHVVIGIYLANRSLDIPGLPKLTAPTFNIVPLKVNVSRDVGLVKVAEEVQRDIALISRAENCGASLREIYEWTTNRVDLIVNFLKVPGEGELEDDIGRQLSGTEQQVGIRLATAEDRERMEEMGAALEGASPFLRGASKRAPDEEATSEIPRDWCLPSIDIEAKVEEGWLRVGVFAPDDMLSEARADTLIEEIGKTLEILAKAEG